MIQPMLIQTCSAFRMCLFHVMWQDYGYLDQCQGPLRCGFQYLLTNNA